MDRPPATLGRPRRGHRNHSPRSSASTPPSPRSYSKTLTPTRTPAAASTRSCCCAPVRNPARFSASPSTTAPPPARCRTGLPGAMQQILVADPRPRVVISNRKHDYDHHRRHSALGVATFSPLRCHLHPPMNDSHRLWISCRGPATPTWLIDADVRSTLRTLSPFSLPRRCFQCSTSD